MREIRSLRGNVNSKFIEDNRPSTQGSREYLKSASADQGKLGDRE